MDIDWIEEEMNRLLKSEGKEPTEILKNIAMELGKLDKQGFVNRAMLFYIWCNFLKLPKDKFHEEVKWFEDNLDKKRQASLESMILGKWLEKESKG